MRKILLALLLTCTAFIGAIAQTSSDEAAIRTLLGKQQAAWNKGDIAAFMEGYWKSDSLTFTGASGITYSWKKTYENYLKRYDSPAKMGTLQFTLLEFRPLGNNYYEVIGAWHLTRTVGDVGGHFTLLFQRFADGWKIIADHTS